MGKLTIDIEDLRTTEFSALMVSGHNCKLWVIYKVDYHYFKIEQNHKMIAETVSLEKALEIFNNL